MSRREPAGAIVVRGARVDDLCGIDVDTRQDAQTFQRWKPGRRHAGVMAGEANGFEYAVVGEEVVVSHHGRRASTLRGQAARRFLAQVEDDPQEVMARVTGNYKRGNERTATAHPRNQGR